MLSLNEVPTLMSEKPIVELDVPLATAQEVLNVQLVIEMADWAADPKVSAAAPARAITNLRINHTPMARPDEIYSIPNAGKFFEVLNKTLIEVVKICPIPGQQEQPAILSEDRISDYG